MNRFLASLFLIICISTTSLAQEWERNMDTAQMIATDLDRPIILVFQGSDWCAPCIKLDREVFQTEAFQLYAKDHFVMVEADFPRKKKNALPEAQQKHNAMLAEKYNKRGIFPYVVILNNKGEKLGETGYTGMNASDYIIHLQDMIR